MKSEKIEVCPDCNSPRIEINSSNKRNIHTEKYRCKDCKCQFESPSERERKRKETHPTHGLARTLSMMGSD